MKLQNSLSELNLSDFSVSELLDAIFPIVIKFGLQALAALAILVIGLFIAGRIKRAVRLMLSKTKRIDPIVIGFLASLAHYTAIATVIIAVIGVFDVPITSFAAILGAAGLAIGLALQGSLSHVASGVMLLIFRPFKLGDFISAGSYEGSIRDINLFFTEMATTDNRKVIIPNGMIWDSAIINFAAYGKRRVDLIFGISYDDDLDKARDIIRKTCAEYKEVQQDPEPIIEVESLGDFSVNILCRFWVDADDFLGSKWAITRAVKQAFDREGISIPFPTHVEYKIDKTE